MHKRAKLIFMPKLAEIKEELVSNFYSIEPEKKIK